MSQAHRTRPSFSAFARPISTCLRVTPGCYPPAGSNEFRRRMQTVGEALHRHNVATVFLVHGSSGELEHDYSENYADCFQTGLRAQDRPETPVRLFHWSGENHDLGCVDGAVRLLEELASLNLDPGRRVLLWGHQHACDVLALTTVLLANRPTTVERVFRAAEVYYRWPILGCVDIPVWNRVRGLLAGGRLLEGVELDCVILGRAPRYSWDVAGCSRRLHLVSSQTSNDSASVAEPLLSAWRARLANRRLGQVLPHDRQGDAAERPSNGTTIVVEYGAGEAGGGPRGPVDAAFTRIEWLLFHAEETVRRFYSARAARVA